MARDLQSMFLAKDMPDFLMEIANRPDATAKGYAKDYLSFFNESYGGFSGQTVTDFLSLPAPQARKRVMAYFLKRKAASPATLCRVSSALRTLVAVARANEETLLSPEDIPRPNVRAKPYRDTSGVGEDDLAKMVKCAVGPRDKAIIVLLGAMGIRRGELAKLLVEDYERTGTDGILHVMSKGLDGQKEAVPVPEPLCALLDEMLSARKPLKRSDPLFAGYRRKGISEQGITFVVKALATAAGITKIVSPHRLRHSAATIALDKGARIEEVQSLLRHRTIATTQIYDSNRLRYEGVAAHSNVEGLLG